MLGFVVSSHKQIVYPKIFSDLTEVVCMAGHLAESSDQQYITGILGGRGDESKPPASTSRSLGMTSLSNGCPCNGPRRVEPVSHWAGCLLLAFPWKVGGIGKPKLAVKGILLSFRGTPLKDIGVS